MVFLWFKPSDAAAMPAVKAKDSGARRRMAPPGIRSLVKISLNSQGFTNFLWFYIYIYISLIINIADIIYIYNSIHCFYISIKESIRW